jgi:RHS repeat-associated protein
LLYEVDYKYDVFGNRVEADVDPEGDGDIDAITRYALDGWQSGRMPASNSDWNVWAELDGQNSNALLTRYLRGDVVDQIFAREDGSGNAYWTLTDRLGSVRDVTDNTGAVKDTLAYDAYGNITSETASAYRGNYAWTGREFDGTTGLQYTRARYYDPKTGRWQSQDSLGFGAGDSNLYRYVQNSPTNSTDPSGLLSDGLAGLFDGLSLGILPLIRWGLGLKWTGVNTGSGEYKFSVGLGEVLGIALVLNEVDKRIRPPPKLWAPEPFRPPQLPGSTSIRPAQPPQQPPGPTSIKPGGPNPPQMPVQFQKPPLQNIRPPAPKAPPPLPRPPGGWAGLAGKAGKALGWVGLGISAWQFYQDAQENGVGAALWHLTSIYQVGEVIPHLPQAAQGARMIGPGNMVTALWAVATSSSAPATGGGLCAGLPSAPGPFAR